MLYGFEEQTCELNAKEMEFLPFVVDLLRKSVGEHNAIKSEQVCDLVAKEFHRKFGDARFRKLVHYIRYHNLVPLLCSSSVGNWIEHDLERYEKWIGSMEGRARSCMQIVYAARRHMPPKGPTYNSGEQASLMDYINQ